MIGLLFKLLPIGIMVFALRDNLDNFSGQMGDFLAMGNRAATESTMHVMANELGAYMQFRDLPRSIDAVGKIMRDAMPPESQTDYTVDMWRQPFVLEGRCRGGSKKKSTSRFNRDDGSTCVLISIAQDGILGTDDDIRVEIQPGSKFVPF